MLPKMSTLAPGHRWLLLLGALLLSPVAARAGEISTREFPAKVTAVAVVERFSFEDRIARFDDPKAPPRTGGPACAITVSVGDAFFSKPETLYASVAACERLLPGEPVSLQYLGLATYFQFVAIRVRGEWASLPMMRESGTKHSTMRPCLMGSYDECALIAAPPL